MREPPDTFDCEAALRAGLRGLPTPDPSPDFDAGVLTALRAPRAWWQTLWQEARPLLAGASCAAVLTLAALSWSLQTPPPPGSPPGTASPRPVDMAALEHLLDRPGLSAASLTEIAAPAPDGHRASPPPRRRVSRLNTPLIT